MLLRFAKKNSINIAVVSLLFVSLLFMSLDIRKRGKLSILEEVVMEGASAAQAGITHVLQSFKDIWFGYIYLVGIGKENLALRDEAARMRERINTMRETVIENQRLRELLAFKDSSGLSVVTSRVIGIGPTNLFETITIAKGTADGVAKGMAVVTSNGVVGRVLSASDGSSKVLLITDRNSYVDAVIQRSRGRGVAQGDLSLLQLKYLDRSTDAVSGDILVTSGIGGIFPKGLVIGSISKVDKNAGGTFQYAEIKPAVDFSKLEEVFVVTGSTIKVE